MKTAIVIATLAFLATTGHAQAPTEDSVKWAKRYLYLAGYEQPTEDTIDSVAVRMERVALWCTTSDRKVASTMILATSAFRGVDAVQVARLVYLTILELRSFEGVNVSETRCIEHLADSIVDPEYDAAALPVSDLNDVLASKPLPIELLNAKRNPRRAARLKDVLD